MKKIPLLCILGLIAAVPTGALAAGNGDTEVYATAVLDVVEQLGKTDGFDVEQFTAVITNLDSKDKKITQKKVLDACMAAAAHVANPQQFCIDFDEKLIVAQSERIKMIEKSMDLHPSNVLVKKKVLNKKDYNNYILSKTYYGYAVYTNQDGQPGAFQCFLGDSDGSDNCIKNGACMAQKKDNTVFVCDKQQDGYTVNKGFFVYTKTDNESNYKAFAKKAEIGTQQIDRIEQIKTDFYKHIAGDENAANNDPNNCNDLYVSLAGKQEELYEPVHINVNAPIFVEYLNKIYDVFGAYDRLSTFEPSKRNNPTDCQALARYDELKDYEERIRNIDTNIRDMLDKKQFSLLGNDTVKNDEDVKTIFANIVLNGPSVLQPYDESKALDKNSVTEFTNLLGRFSCTVAVPKNSDAQPVKIVYASGRNYARELKCYLDDNSSNAVDGAGALVGLFFKGAKKAVQDYNKQKK